MPHEHFHLFTYGSLKAGGPRGAAHEVLAGCERVAEATVRGTLYDMGEYPALLLSGTDVVRGVVWRCPSDRLRGLDAYEGTEAGLFRRAATWVGGRACWVYVAGPRLGPRLVPESRITEGEWTP